MSFEKTMAECNMDIHKSGIVGLAEKDSYAVDELPIKTVIVELTEAHEGYSVQIPTNCEVNTSKNEKLPELFHEDDQSEESGSADLTCFNKYNDGSSVGMPLINNINQREQEILRRMQLSLSGLPPPPSVTIVQLDVISAIAENKDKIYSFFNKSLDCANSGGCINRSIFKSSHSYIEITNMDWPNILNINHHGLCFNLSSTTEKIDHLNLSLVERFIGAETSSSFVRYYSECSTKNKSTETRMLLQSPSTRLSHLAKRRATFSSANLLSNQTLYGCNKQIILESKKLGTRKELRINTPKRKSFDRIKIDAEITSNSKAAKTIFYKSDYPTSGLYKDSLKGKERLLVSETSTHVELTNREKSKRALFSRSDFEKSSTHGIISEISTFPNDKRLPYCLKRKRCEDLNDDEEIDQIEFKAQIPRTLKYKSQSFCEATTSNKLTTGNSIFRASSDTTFHGRELSENHKKKLLWAVSQALHNKNISVQHPNFKQYASVLARVVKRIFLEIPKRSGSASDIMLSLAKKYTYCVIQGKTIDQLYSFENITIGNLNSKPDKLTGYITQEDFESRRKSSSQVFAENSINSFGLSKCAAGYNKLTSKSPLSELLQLNNDDMQQGTHIIPKKSTQSSSKNNLNGAILRENFDVDLRGSSQKKIALKHINPYVGNMANLASRLLDTNALKAKRQILFDK